MRTRAALALFTLVCCSPDEARTLPPGVPLAPPSAHPSPDPPPAVPPNVEDAGRLDAGAATDADVTDAGPGF